MRRRALLRTLVGLTLAVSAVLAGLVGVVLHEPPSYHLVPVPAEPERRMLSGEFVSAVNQMSNSIGGKLDENRWQETFTADQMNSYFEHDFTKTPPFQLPRGLHSPRVVIRPSHFQFAFKYGHGFWSTVVTADLNLWLVAKEPNVVAIELLALRAGAMPVSAQSFLEEISEGIKQSAPGVEVSWYRHDGHPVALVKFQADREHPTFLLQRLELQDGKLVVAGKSSEAAPPRPVLSMLSSAGR